MNDAGKSLDDLLNEFVLARDEEADGELEGPAVKDRSVY